MWKDELTSQVRASSLSDEDKQAWLSFAELLDDEMGSFFVSHITEEPGALERMNEEVQVRKDFIQTGDPEKLKQVKAQNQALAESYQVVQEQLPSAGPSGCIECHAAE